MLKMLGNSNSSTTAVGSMALTPTSFTFGYGKLRPIKSGSRFIGWPLRTFPSQMGFQKCAWVLSQGNEAQGMPP